MDNYITPAAQAVGRGVQTALPYAENVAGLLAGLPLAAYEIDRRGPLGYLQARNQLLQDPGIRQMAGPFTAGFLEVAGGPQNFPPLGAEQQLQTQLARMQLEGLQHLTPEQQQQAVLASFGVHPQVTPPPGWVPTRIGPQGATYQPPPPGPEDFQPVPGSGGRLMYSPGLRRTATVPLAPGQAAGANIEAQYNFLRQHPELGMVPGQAPGLPALPAQAPPQEAPAPPPPAQPSQLVGGLAPDLPASQWPLAGQAQQPAQQGPQGPPGAQFPSPAFDDAVAVQTPRGPLNVPAWAQALAGGQPAAAQTLPPAAAPAQSPLPRGTTRTSSFRLGPFSQSTRQQGPPAGRQLPAITSRGIAQEVTASQAAQQALEILRRGPQAPMTVRGVPTGMSPGFAGPATGRLMHGYQSVVGDPRAVEQAQLEAFIAHARSGILGIVGLRPNEFSMHQFDPLMPNVNQPTEILETHLQRLIGFYDSLARMQEVLSNVTDEQRAQIHQQLFIHSMAGPTPIDLGLGGR